MSLDTEEWKTIDQLNRYQISNQGRVKSLIGTEKILSQSVDKDGYLRVKLSDLPIEKGKYQSKDFRIHRLVAQFFCEDFAENKEVHHKNLLRWDNRCENLICLTRAEHAELHRKLKEQDTSGKSEEENRGNDE